MIKVFMVLLICNGGDIRVFEQNRYPTHQICEAVRISADEENKETLKRSQCRTICIQSEVNANRKGEKNAIYHQASGAYR